jgi:hypothetical protein
MLFILYKINPGNEEPVKIEINTNSLLKKIIDETLKIFSKKDVYKQYPKKT